METITPGVELIHAIIQTARDIADAIHGETIAQLRDELVTAKRNLQAADDLLDKVGSIITAAIGCSGSGVLHDAVLLAEELVKCKAKLANVKEDTADLIIERDQLKQRAERAEKERDAQYEDNAHRIAMQAKAENERDEALAKLEQPRMFMRDGQLWEVFNGSEKRATTDDMYALHPDGWYKTCNNVTSSALLYRRPITPQELQGWIEPQPSGEVLFEGVRYFSEDGLNHWKNGYLGYHDAQRPSRINGTHYIPVHVTIRKAGE